jgi:transcriptional regulator GlxA family with amidase domain
MSDRERKLNVALLAVPEVTASTLFGIFDIMASSGRDWAALTTGQPGQSALNPYIVARGKESFKALNDITVTPHYALGEEPRPDIVCVPDFFIMPGDSCAGRFDSETRWLNECYNSGAVIASACSGALLLAEAGLLDDCDATIHWGFRDMLEKHYPKVRFHPNRTLVVAGEDGRIITGGGGTTWQDLALFIIAKFVSVKDAVEVAKVNLIDWHDLGQQSYASLVTKRHTGDAQIADCQAWVAENYAEAAPVAAMIEMSGLAERSFTRRFSQATGMTPLQYVHAVRLEEAKQMLETTDDAIEAIANEVGYEDASFFGRLFLRNVGVTPAQYRRRYVPLRKAGGQPA